MQSIIGEERLWLKECSTTSDAKGRKRADP